jgi:hypothetical protein
MKLRNLIFAIAGFSILFGCAAKESTIPRTPFTRIEQKIKEAVAKTRRGESTGPLALSHRKLRLSEIAEHLDMDEETAKLHLKATNIHGYYSLIAKNYPPGMEFVLYHIDISGKIIASKAFSVNEFGKLITPLENTSIELQNNFLFFSNYLPGEPIEFVLASKDEKYFAATRIIPNPIEATDGGQRRISVEIASPNKREYIVHCSGFKPCGEYMLITRFENEKFLHYLETNLNGEMFQRVGPTAPWITGGDGAIEVRGEDIASPIILNFEWGA